jgi:hypothetical protein
MIGCAALVAGCAWTADAGRRGHEGDSGEATALSGPWRSGAAGRVQTDMRVAEPVIS